MILNMFINFTSILNVLGEIKKNITENMSSNRYFIIDFVLRSMERQYDCRTPFLHQNFEMHSAKVTVVMFLYDSRTSLKDMYV